MAKHLKSDRLLYEAFTKESYNDNSANMVHDADDMLSFAKWYAQQKKSRKKHKK